MSHSLYIHLLSASVTMPLALYVQGYMCMQKICIANSQFIIDLHTHQSIAVTGLKDCNPCSMPASVGILLHKAHASDLQYNFHKATTTFIKHILQT